MELIERAGVLKLLQEKLDHVEQAEGHCVFVSGDAGIGKTSLVKAFCKQQQDACLIYQGACDALFTPRPLAPVYDIIWQLRHDLWPGSHTIEQRSELFLKLFHELKSKNQKILIVFDDIHWADEATLDFIKFLSRRIAQLRCLFLLTYRDDGVNPGHLLRNVLDALLPEVFTRIQLEPLSKQAVQKLADEKGYDAENVYKISGGNPFYVNEILAHYSPGVPENIKDSILAVYDRQEEGTKNAWEICSIIPEGLEISRFARLKSSWEGMDRCFALKIIVVKNDRVIFKHELYRRTIEASLSPFKRIALNKRMLDLFLDSFEEQGDIERIVQYAKNANENGVVVTYAPVAARQAAAVGAHIEASKLFLTSIEYHDGKDKDQLLALYEAYAYECYLTNQTKDAIIYYSKSLDLWKRKGEMNKVGNCLFFLSRLWWINDDPIKAESFAEQAIEVLSAQPASSVQAMAYSLMSQLKMFFDLPDQCITWGQKAMELAHKLSDHTVLSYALGSIGSVQIRKPAFMKEGLALLRQSLDIALENSFEYYAGMAYVNMGYNGLIVKNHDLAEEAVMNGLPYCEENNLDLWKFHLLAVKANLRMETGDWAEAHDIAKKLVEDEKPAKNIKVLAFTILGRVGLRRGSHDEALLHLKEATTRAMETKEPQRILHSVTAFLEYEWVSETRQIDLQIFENALELLQGSGNTYTNSEFAFWLQKARKQSLSLTEICEGYDLSTSAQTIKAATFWEKKGNRYNEALLLFEGTAEEKRKAIAIVQDLGADAVCRKLKEDMRSSGIKKIPRGLRASTKANLAQLTNRELDVLQLLQKGAQNKEIAGTLFISPKTVDNHISNIYFKLDVSSRGKAVREAVRLGILK